MSGLTPAAHISLPLSRVDLAALGLRGLHCSPGRILYRGFLSCGSQFQSDHRGNATTVGRLYELGQHFHLQHDFTTPLPIDDESFDWVLSDHLIQRFKPDQAVCWFRDLHRLLKPGGVMRLSTPDLALYVSGYADPQQTFYQKHQAHLKRMGLGDCPSRPAWMLNQIFRNYGHQWIYDLEELTLVARAAGFDPALVLRCGYRQGSVPELAELDQEIRSDESLYVEIQKPARPVPGSASAAVPGSRHGDQDPGVAEGPTGSSFSAAPAPGAAAQVLPLRGLQPLRQPIQPDAVSLFAVIGDEPYFLPHFLSHYRQLGINAFTLYLDRPTPETLQLLAPQRDVELFTSEIPFGAVYGKHATGALIRFHNLMEDQFTQQHFAGRWALTVDADEFAVLPSGFTDIGSFCRYLERQNLVHVSAPMVDFYPAHLSERSFNSNLSPFDGCPWFDRGPYYEWQPPALIPRHLHSGVRERITRYLSQNHPDEWQQVVGPNYAYQPPKVWKVPLMKHGCGVQRQLMHEASVTPHPGINLALAHFKYHPGIDAKVSQAISRAEHYRGALEYKIINLAFRYMANVDLRQASSSRRWQGARSLEEAGLISTCAS